MHDDLGADISHLLLLARESMSSQDLSHDGRTNLVTIEQHAEGMVQKIDEIIWSLDPSDDRLLSTLTFLQRYCEDLATAHKVAFRTKPIEGTDRPYPSAMRRELYLLVKEVVINIFKHTSATSLRFDAFIAERYFTVLVEDNGKAVMNGTRERNGHGLHNMRQRLEKLNAELISEPLTPGTRLRIQLHFA
jgi:signal transduction histidine kinase